MDDDMREWIISENRKRAADIMQLTKAMHAQDREIQALKREVAMLKAQPGEGGGPSIAQTVAANADAKRYV